MINEMHFFHIYGLKKSEILYEEINVKNRFVY